MEIFKTHLNLMKFLKKLSQKKRKALVNIFRAVKRGVEANDKLVKTCCHDSDIQLVLFKRRNLVYKDDGVILELSAI